MSICLTKRDKMNGEGKMSTFQSPNLQICPLTWQRGFAFVIKLRILEGEIILEYLGWPNIDTRGPERAKGRQRKFLSESDVM